LRDVEQALARGIPGEPAIVSLQPDCLDRIWEDFRRVARALGIAEKGDEVIAQLQRRMAALTPPPEVGPPPRVACIEWMEPPMAAGNWMPELIRMAGGVNLFGENGRHSPWLTWEELRDADPDVMILAPCGFDLDRTAKELYWMTGRTGWCDLRAVREERVYLGDGNRYFNRPGPRVVETLQALVEMLHPEFHKPGLRGTAWRVMMSK
jgi:iron complex transport system substrate-binding protein